MRTETREKVVKYEVYIAKDGKEFLSSHECEDYEKYLNGTRKKCPMCGGLGSLKTEWVEAYDNYDIGHVEAHWEYKKCTKCNGKGYLDKKVTWE